MEVMEVPSSIDDAHLLLVTKSVPSKRASSLVGVLVTFQSHLEYPLHMQYTHCHGDGCAFALLKSAIVAANLWSGHYMYMHLRVYWLALSVNFDLPYNGVVLNRVVYPIR